MTATLAREPSCAALARLYAYTWRVLADHEGIVGLPLQQRLSAFDLLTEPVDDGERARVFIADIELERKLGRVA